MLGIYLVQVLKHDLSKKLMRKSMGAKAQRRKEVKFGLKDFKSLAYLQALEDGFQALKYVRDALQYCAV